MNSLYLTQKTSLTCKYPVALVESGVTPRELAPTLTRDTNYSKNENVIKIIYRNRNHSVAIDGTFIEL
jgi:hypothetical protein